MAKKRKKKSHLNPLYVLALMAIGIWILVSCVDDNPFVKPVDSNVDSEVEDVAQDNTKENETPTAVEEIDEEVVDTAPEEEATVEEPEVDTEEPQGDSDEDAFDPEMDAQSLSKGSVAWSWKRNSDHEPVIAYDQGIDLSALGAYYKVNTEEKVVYLTFDEGYENGYTSQILDILEANDVHATFFVTQPYIESNPELCIRMKESGNLVGNHSTTHGSFPDMTEEEITYELTETQKTFEELTGYEMDAFFRYPSGNYSEYSLYVIRNLGYRSIFWSLGYKDWDVNDQPGKEYAYEHIMENYHPGGIFLLHAVSQSTTEALDQVIKDLKAEGYRFGSLYEVE